MNSSEQTLQIEVTIAPPKANRKGGRHGIPVAPNVPDPPRIPRIARLMALAIKFQEMVDGGEGCVCISSDTGNAREASVSYFSCTSAGAAPFSTSFSIWLR